VDKYIFIRYKSRITSKFWTVVHIYTTKYISSFLRVIFKGILRDS